MAMPSDNYSVCVQNSNPTELSWLEETLDNLNITHKRKRHDSTPSDESDCYSDSEDAPDAKLLKDNSPYKSDNWKLIGKMMTSRVQDGSTQNFLKLILSCLSNDELRSVAPVCKEWNKTTKAILRDRNGSSPFLLLWKSDKQTLRRRSFNVDRFVSSLADGSPPVQAVLLTGTTSICDHLQMLYLHKGEFLKGVNWSMAFSEQFLATTPDHQNILQLNDGHALHALCIPYSHRLVIRSFVIPIWNTLDQEATQLAHDAFYNSTKTPDGYRMVGMTLLQYCVNSDVNSMVVSRIARENGNAPLPLVGGNIYETMTREDVTSVSCGWAIFGNSDVRALSIAVEVGNNYNSLDAVLQGAQQHFKSAESGFILMFYEADPDICDELVRKLRENVQPSIPVVGVRTTMGFTFQGDTISFDGSCEYSYFPNDLLPKFKVTLLFVAY